MVVNFQTFRGGAGGCGGMHAEVALCIVFRGHCYATQDVVPTCVTKKECIRITIASVPRYPNLNTPDKTNRHLSKSYSQITVTVTA